MSITFLPNLFVIVFNFQAFDMKFLSLFGKFPLYTFSYTKQIENISMLFVVFVSILKEGKTGY